MPLITLLILCRFLSTMSLLRFQFIAIAFAFFAAIYAAMMHFSFSFRHDYAAFDIFAADAFFFALPYCFAPQLMIYAISPCLFRFLFAITLYFD